LFDVLFYLLFVLLVSGHYYLNVSLFKKIQNYEKKALSSSKREARQVNLDHIDPIYSLSSLHIGLHALILSPKPHTVGI
jgi:hypothetical protein